MSDQEFPHGELNELEGALAALKPRAGQFNRDRMMFLAGQAAAAEHERRSRRKGRWARLSAAAAAMAFAAGLGAALSPFARPPRERIVYLRAESDGAAPAHPAPRTTLATNSRDDTPASIAARSAKLDPHGKQLSYLDLRQQVLEGRSEWWGRATGPAAAAEGWPAAYHDLLQTLLADPSGQRPLPDVERRDSRT